MNGHDCMILEWVWGDIIRCADCGARFHSPDEAAALRPDQDVAAGG